MHSVKRIEIVIDKPHEPEVRKLLKKLGVPGFTIFEAVSGFGDRGRRDGGELTDAMVNRYVITTCAAEQLDALTASLKPLLERYGGLCLISDAQLIRDPSA